MSVPPPSCTPSSTSTGSASWSERSTTSVSNATRWVRIDPTPWKIAAVTAEWITELAIDPDWSTATMTCHRSTCRRTRLANSGRLMTSWPLTGSTLRRLARMVARASKFAATRCRLGRRGSRTPANGLRTGVASRSRSSATTCATTVRAAASTWGAMRLRLRRIAVSSAWLGVTAASASASSTRSSTPRVSTARSTSRSATERGNSSCTSLIQSVLVRKPEPVEPAVRDAPSSRKPSASSRRASSPTGRPSASSAAGPSTSRHRRATSSSSSGLEAPGGAVTAPYLLVADPCAPPRAPTARPPG
ncbi:hypothetical protein QE405_003482 [Nocardioides zeae]|uniref:Uncharacterized protein n=1 Tax=Nocardioides zeae TaxID=1457234 RepID=A0AAJ1U6M6_9ACTN|nr:hypothetical protein [Nocardioides zeae]